MPINVVCDQCGKAYAADDKLAGRRVRCRGCGHIVTVPQVDGGDDGPNLDSLAQVERSFAGGDAMMTRAGTHTGLPHDDPAEPQLPTGTEDVPLSGEGIEFAGRANLRFNFAGAREVDMALPWILAVGSALWLFVQAARSSPPGSGWVTITSSLAWIAVYAGLVAPIVFAALRSAGRKVGFQLPRTARWRTFASYLPAFVLTATMWMMDLGAARSMLIGSIGGLLLASCCIYVLFRLRPEEAPPTAAMGAGGYVVGLVLACAGLFGANHLFKAIVESTDSASTFAASPFGSGFDWAKDSQRIVRTSNTPTNRTRVFEAERAERNEAPAPPPPAVNRPPPVTGNLIEAGTTAASTALLATLPTGPVFDVGPQVAAPASPLVSSFSPASEMRERSDRFIFPLTPSQFVGVMRQEGDVVRLWAWDCATWKPVNTKPVTIRAVHGLDDYALSPDGKWFARTSTFVSREIELYSTTDPDSTPRKGPPGDASLMGFLPREQLVARLDEPGRIVLDVFNLVDGRNADQGVVRIPAPTGEDKCMEIVGDARFVAVLNQDSRGVSAVRCYSLRSDRGEASREVYVAPPSSDWPALPSGFTISVDGPRLEDNAVAMLFERDGGAIIYVNEVSTGRKIGEYQDRAGRLPRRPVGYLGPALTWVGSGKSRQLLVYGRTIVNPSTGGVSGEIDLSNVIDVSIVDPKTLIFVCGTDRHPIPVRVQLNLP